MKEGDRFEVLNEKSIPISFDGLFGYVIRRGDTGTVLKVLKEDRASPFKLPEKIRLRFDRLKIDAEFPKDEISLKII
ncbi:hypothetical protein EBB07_29035 [Paenibacillaceae bacterium]|nr:hypothetical protein EBB07_29035 [Paenibacillaceae bacterium]